MHAYKAKLCTALTATLILVGCGGSGSSSSPSPASVTPPPTTTSTTTTATPTESAPTARNIFEAVSIKTAPLAQNSNTTVASNPLSGVAAKGIMGGARIVVFDALTPPEDVGEDGATLLGEGVTNADGTYSLSLQTTEDTSDYLAIGAFFEGATMICDAPSGCFDGVAFGERISIGENDEALWAIFPKPTAGEAAVANLNLFTHFQLFRMLGIAYDEQAANDEAEDPITLKAEHFTPAFEYVSNAFGLESDHFHTIPYIDPTQPIGSSNVDAINMGLLSAGYFEAGIQSEITKNGDEANLNEVLSNTILPFFLPNILLPLNERDTDNNPRTVSLEDMFEAALVTAERNTAQNNSLSLAIDFLTEQNALIDTLTYSARLEVDGTYPEERRTEEEAETETETETDTETGTDTGTETNPDPDPDPYADETVNDESCRPSLSPQPTDNIVLLSGYEGTAVSSVAVTSLDKSTQVTRVRIEEGETPLYIIASTYTDMVWSIEGNTNRVAGFVATNGIQPGFEGAGVVGLPEDKVNFIDHACMEFFTETSSRTASAAQSQFETLFEREVDHIIAGYTLDSVAIPSGVMMDYATREENESAAIAAGQSQITADNGITFNIKSQTSFADQTQLFRFTQEGLATVPVSKVVSSGPAMTYDVFPSHAGLVQLLSSGHIEYKGMDNTYTDSYFIRKTFPRFPAELSGAESVTFTLGTGVELPGGDLGHSRVFSEETGECIKGLC